MIIFGKKIKTWLFVVVVIITALAIYFAVNYKQVKQDFVDGLNDGKAQRAREDSAQGK